MSNIPWPVTAKELMHRWEINSRQLLFIMKEHNLKPYKPDFNTEVEVGKLMLGMDITKNLDRVLGDLIFLMKDIEAIAENIGNADNVDGLEISDFKRTKKDDRSDKTSVEMISNIKVGFENDNEVIFQIPNHKAKTCSFDRLGFKNPETNEWRDFIKILENDNSFHVGPSEKPNSAKRKAYDKNQETLRAINKKLVKFLKTDFSLDIPDGYKLFKRDKAKGQGVYRLQFKRLQYKDSMPRMESQYENFPKEKLFSYLKNISAEYLRKPEDYLFQKIKAVSNTLMERHGVTEIEIQEVVNPTTDREAIKEDFENKVDSDKWYSNGYEIEAN